MSKLALLGGEAVIKKEFDVYKSVGDKEYKSLKKVIENNSLSGFFGSWGEYFMGGKYVKEFEAEWSKRFNVKHTVSVNSNTTGLMTAMGAIGISPGDEVIVPPCSMSATAITPLFYGGIPVFADVEEGNCCLDPESVKANITEKTKAIFVVNIFGNSAKLHELKKIAEENNLYLIEDAAQCPLSTEEDGSYCGTIGDIGIFSLNYHKHIHTGEGGMCVTNDDILARKMQLIRNHAENSAEQAGIDDLTNMIGLNFRLTELSAAIGLSQLEDIDLHVGKREKIAHFLSDMVRDLDGLQAPDVRNGVRHVYYVWAMRYDAQKIGVSRKTFCDALTAEGFPNFEGYGNPLYLLPPFQKRIAIGRDGFPFNLTKREYKKGLCPVYERMHYEELIGFEPCRWQIEDEDLPRLKEAFMKVYNNLEQLKEYEQSKLGAK